jgi:hypothetical protein
VAIDSTTLTADKTTSGSIKNWVNRSDIPATDILTEAEAYIYQQLRAREMLSTTPLSIAAAASSVALPADFLDPIRFLPYEWGSPLPLTHEAVLYDTRDSSGALFDGTPSQWAIFDGTMTVNSTIPTGETFSGILTYYAQPTALSGSNETNFLTTRYPTLLRRACLKHAYEHMKDWPSFERQEALTQAAVFEANQTNEMWRRGQQYPA